MKAKPGRPPSANPKAAPLQVRYTAEQRAHVEAEAEKAGMKLSDWIRSKTLPKRLRD